MKYYTFTYSYVTTEDSDTITLLYKTKEQAVLKLKAQVAEERNYYSLGDDSYDKEEMKWEHSTAKIQHNEWDTSFHTFAYDGEHQAEGKITEHEETGDTFRHNPLA